VGFRGSLLPDKMEKSVFLYEIVLKQQAGNMREKLIITPGSPLPLGATPKAGGVQFSIISRHSSRVFLQLYREPQDSEPYEEIELDKEKFKTGDIWHIHIKGLDAGQLYLYRMDGEYNPEKGHRFNPNIYLIDPYAKALTSNFKWNFRRAGSFNNPKDTLKEATTMPKCIVVNDDSFDWGDDKPLKIPLRDTVIYETHIRGLTVHYSSNIMNAGTYRGVVEKIPYFKKLGITALEFLPVHEFDTIENYRVHPKTGKILKNYWGYSTISFFAPKGLYAYPVTLYSENDIKGLSIGHYVNDFKYMVKELHKNGIEVILDVVFNHTAEGNEEGPVLNFKGIDNSIYYMLLDKDKSKYKNYSGCGNTLNCNHPIVRSLIMDSLHYWVNEMHVDGFRFDLASILGRDQNGEIMENAPLLEHIAEDPLLRDIKIIAEAWDAGGAYQVGGFRNRWGELNGKYRDDVRRFWRGDEGLLPYFATRLTGSSDLYHKTDRTPLHSINFITSHDGFTLNDLVSYNKKHNEDNGEDNRDGSNQNYSCNFGVEGDTKDKKIEYQRKKQIKNFIATLFMSQGVPMILGGDEFRRTQKGNNNAYCQDNEISWYDWSFLEKHKEIFEFTKSMIQLRKSHPIFTRESFFTGKSYGDSSIPDVSWFNEEGDEIDWTDPDCKCMSVLLSGNKYNVYPEKHISDEKIGEHPEEQSNLPEIDKEEIETKLKDVPNDDDALIMFNTDDEDIEIIIPKIARKIKWKVCIDTGKGYGKDVKLNPEDRTPIKNNRYEVKKKSLVLLLSEDKARK
jgi:isoamylase